MSFNGDGTGHFVEEDSTTGAVAAQGWIGRRKLYEAPNGRKLAMFDLQRGGLGWDSSLLYDRATDRMYGSSSTAGYNGPGAQRMLSGREEETKESVAEAEGKEEERPCPCRHVKIGAFI